jgi:Ca2+-binding EF-hand superfamily protein
MAHLILQNKTPQTTAQKLWRKGYRTVKAEQNISIKAVVPTNRNGGRQLRSRATWGRVTQDSLLNLKQAEGVMDTFVKSDERRHKKLSNRHKTSQRRLSSRLKKRHGNKKKYKLQTYADISARMFHDSSQLGQKQTHARVAAAIGTRTPSVMLIPEARTKIKEQAGLVRSKIGKQLSSETQLARVFTRLDQDNSGDLDKLEFQKLIKAIAQNQKITEELLDYLFLLVQAGSNKNVTLPELWCFVKNDDEQVVKEAGFLHGHLKAKIKSEKLLGKIFKKLDANGNGFIGKASFMVFSTSFLVFSTEFDVNLPD